MNRYNISEIIDKIEEVVKRHRLGEGMYKRFPEDDFINPYGCADAANILYTIGRFPSDIKERDGFVKNLQAMQDEDTGLFCEKPSDTSKYVHDPIHTTAHCMAALELFDAKPLYPARALEKYLDKDELFALFDSLEWNKYPGQSSHKGAGIFVALNLGGSDCREFNKAYFKWLWENADPETGFWRKGCIDGSTSKWEYMGGTFHYLFNHEYAHMPLAYPERLIDSCIQMYNEKSRRLFGEKTSFIEVDWVFCLTRSMRQTPHRFYEARECLMDFTEKYMQFWMNADYENDRGINDMHELFGGVCCLAELQSSLRGMLYSDRPLKIVLDRRPFI